jgi:hypothetical protein
VIPLDIEPSDAGVWLVEDESLCRLLGDEALQEARTAGALLHTRHRCG